MMVNGVKLMSDVLPVQLDNGDGVASWMGGWMGQWTSDEQKSLSIGNQSPRGHGYVPHIQQPGSLGFLVVTKSP